MALYVLFCKDLMEDVKKFQVRTLTHFPKAVTFHPPVWALGTGNYLTDKISLTLREAILYHEN